MISMFFLCGQPENVVLEVIMIMDNYRADKRLYQKWYSNQSWANDLDAVLLPSPQPTESIIPADVLVGW